MSGSASQATSTFSYVFLRLLPDIRGARDYRGNTRFPAGQDPPPAEKPWSASTCISSRWSASSAALAIGTSRSQAMDLVRAIMCDDQVRLGICGGLDPARDHSPVPAAGRHGVGIRVPQRYLAIRRICQGPTHGLQCRICCRTYP